MKAKEKVSKSKYAQLLKESRDPKANCDIEYLEAKARMSMESAIIETKREIAELNMDLNKAYVANPFDPAALYEVSKKLLNREKRLEKYRKIQSFLFGTKS